MRGYEEQSREKNVIKYVKKRDLFSFFEVKLLFIGDLDKITFSQNKENFLLIYFHYFTIIASNELCGELKD